VAPATGAATVPELPPRVTSWIDIVPHTQRRYRTHPSDVEWVDSTFASSAGHPQRAHLMIRVPFL
jgi:hypothetical protein